MVTKLVYCSNCGAQIADDAYFCPKCGTKTEAGKTAKAVYPADELRDVFYQVGIELEKAFTLAAHETQAAFRRVSEEIHQKPASSQPQQTDTVTCTSCGAKNTSGAIFCGTCGKKIAQESSGSAPE
jgi:ribosomal protein L40E